MSRSGRGNDLTTEQKHELCHYKEDAVPLEAACAAASTLAQSMSEHPDEFGAEAELIIEQRVARPLETFTEWDYGPSHLTQ